MIKKQLSKIFSIVLFLLVPSICSAQYVYGDPIATANNNIRAVSKSIGVVINDVNVIKSQMVIQNTKLQEIENIIQESDKNINNLIKESIDKLPQRLLSEEAKNYILTSILAEMKIEIGLLRSDLQRQIDEIRIRK